MAEHFEPGDYQLSDGGTNLYVALPSGANAFCVLTRDKWTWTEEDDGTLTVSPSIFDTSAGGYHGFLQCGIWSDPL
jgi:hypothetical protein